MDLIQLLKDDLETGFSKSQLEQLIGLPLNSLSSVISGHKTLSKKSQLKVKHFMLNPKSNPLQKEVKQKLTEKEPESKNLDKMIEENRKKYLKK